LAVSETWGLCVWILVIPQDGWPPAYVRFIVTVGLAERATIPKSTWPGFNVMSPRMKHERLRSTSA
jgi:hypothetical protein